MERFGRFVLLEHIAQGGMAEVFRAASIGCAGFTRQLAIKRILPHLAADPHFTRLLIEEAHIASALHHPNIVQVLDLGEESGSFFIAMEYVAGRSLNKVFTAALARSMPLPQAFAVHAAIQVLHALHYAHTRTDAHGEPLKLIHRDVSPHNVLVAYDGSIKLADFGIAKVSSQGEHTTGPIKGKPGYMSPEQVGEGPIDQRVDLYAVGVMLHELLCMRRMRVADNPMRMLMEVAKGAFPRFEELGVDVPPSVADAVYRALAPWPDERWPDARQFCMALEEASKDRGWHWTASHVAALMQELHPAEMEQERLTQEHFSSVVQELTAATTQDVVQILARASATESEPTLAAAKPVKLDAPAVALPPAPARSRQAWWMGAALVGVVLPVAWLQFTQAAPPPLPTGGPVTVETTPPGAQAFLDGKQLSGVTPLHVPEVRAGSHELEVRHPGWVTGKQTFEVAEQQPVRVRMELKEAINEVSVTSQPPGATVLINDQPVGTTPTKLFLKGTAPIDLGLSLAGFATVRQNVLAHRAPANIHVSLAQLDAPTTPVRKNRDKPVVAVNKPVAVERPGESVDGGSEKKAGPGWLTLQSRPWARILLDGKDTGRYTPVVNMELPPGEHSIQLINDEDKVGDTFSITIAPGETTRAARTLH